MSKQGVLSYRIESEPTRADLTVVSGLAPYLDLVCASGLVGSIEKNVRASGEQGWRDVQAVKSIVLLNLAGGECVDDLEHLEADKGFGRLVRWCESHTLTRRVRREMNKRWRNIVSATAARCYLAQFHNESQEKLRGSGKALIKEFQ